MNKNPTTLLRCPRCKKLPQNHTDPTIGYIYGCCRVALLTKFSMFQDVAAARWNKRVLKYREQMDGMCHPSKESNEEL
jgi:hypothetical protein